MFGVVFKTFEGRYEMACRKLFSQKADADRKLQELVGDFGPNLMSRYEVVEINLI